MIRFFHRYWPSHFRVWLEPVWAFYLESYVRQWELLGHDSDCVAVHHVMGFGPLSFYWRTYL